ncbi:TetR/AcrR family transcriptional regulator [Lutibaculum baratangense]|uniref:Transcriptional regulator, TetR family n=1 Tax=Lutibaculum baratangense AMV1 TaxID=631454 RepID=V4RJ97_9HYPH|nr:TetR/AcrR family transcriptional regulator [Lutibaculum baratangense]ESR25374.1 Transcriptional regulator, TetR family [Lutibaculum baratangense AMV1]
MSSSTTERAAAAPRRKGAVTRERILQVALSEFAEHGYSGGRIERIAAAAGINVRMIYHYFGNKDDLYLASLEATYSTIRERERELDVADLDPATAMQRLVELTFDFLAHDPHFVRLIMSENLMMGQTIQRSQTIPQMTRPLLETMNRILSRGQTSGLFRQDIDAESLYISILGLCFIHVSNRHTLGSMFNRDLADPAWLAARRETVVEAVTRYLKTDPAQSGRSKKGTAGKRRQRPRS